MMINNKRNYSYRTAIVVAITTFCLLATVQTADATAASPAFKGPTKIDPQVRAKIYKKNEDSIAKIDMMFNSGGQSQNSVPAQRTKANTPWIDACNMRYWGRYEDGQKQYDIPLDELKVSPSTKPTKDRPLWDMMYTECMNHDNLIIAKQSQVRACGFIKWRVPLGVDGDVQRLMLQAQAQLRIPEPSVGLPLFDRAGGKVGVLVRAANWFWTDADTYRAWSKRVEVDGHWAEVTAMPISLEFTPRPGEQPVKCEGPGEVFVPGRDSNAVDAPSGCFYRYRYTTIDDPDMTTTASVGVRWQISWKGSNGKGADIAQIVTSTDQPLQVFEAQTLVTQ